MSLREFQFFDPQAEVTITTGQLPHWQQPGATYFITYRTEDSISKVAMDRILRSRNDWLARNGIDVAQTNWHQQLSTLPVQHQRAFHRRFAVAFETQLDRLSGECLLRRKECSSRISESLHHFDRERYRLGAFVVMPNHIHVLATVFPQQTMLQQCYRWKHFQAFQINQMLARSGPFFQAESFDHLVRDTDHFWKFRRYIAQNPERAKLGEQEFEMYMPEVQ